MKTRHLLLILVVVSVAGIVFAASSYRKAGTSGLAHATAVQQSLVPLQRRVQVVCFTLYDVGIYPQEARATAGSITISIEDLTGSSSGLIIDRLDATVRLPAGVVSKATNLLRARAELFLPAGRYELTDANRRDNRALLIVEP
ncbi:MAG TPA: hypothetical protein VJ875_04625 [Pyrinomonadaceae bacterium]|nr:hypothetical protein [Pyrinomonadaceae bacterium]